MRALLVALVVALGVGSLAGCSSEPTKPKAPGEGGSPPPENSGADGKKKGGRIPDPNSKPK